MSRPPRRRLPLAFVAALAFSASPREGWSAEAPGNQWAVLIAVKKHANPRNNLRFTVEDARLLKETLVRRGGVAEDHVLMLTDDSPEGRRPVLADLRRELPQFLARAGENDRVIVFYSGHGIEKGGRTYLIPADARADDVAGTALPVDEVSEALRRCPARVKFLILDSCQSGGAKAAAVDGPAEPSAEALAKRFVDSDRPIPGCVILASCKAEELSREWAERGQGLFTYWLARALEGGGDENGDGRLTVDEVYKYTHERVSATSAQVFKADQTPVRHFDRGIDGIPVVLTLRPEPPETLCRRLAEHIDLEVRRRGLKKVGVLEFGKPVGRSETLARANLPAVCAALVRSALASLSAGAYAVAGDEVGRGFQFDEIGDPKAMGRLAEQSGGLDGLVVGTLRRRGPNMHLQLDLMSVADGSSLVTPAGLFPISEDLILTESSADVRDRPTGGPYDPQVVAFAETQSRLGHPLLDDAFPFRVELYSVQPAPGETIGPRTRRVKKEFINPAAVATSSGAGAEPPSRQLLVAAREGELFEIRVTNRTDQPVLVTLLVDGLNTLGRKRERLGHGWSWAIGPKQTQTTEGWWSPRNSDARPDQVETFDVRHFVFTDVSRSVAGRLGFGASTGVITAGFFEAKPPGSRGPGVGEGPAAVRQVRTSGYSFGRPLGAVQIRYVDERELR